MFIDGDIIVAYQHCIVCVCCNCQDPKIYVQTILDIHRKYNTLVMTAFSNDSGFVESLDKVKCYHLYAIAVIIYIYSSSDNQSLMAYGLLYY